MIVYVNGPDELNTLGSADKNASLGKKLNFISIPIQLGIFVGFPQVSEPVSMEGR